MNGTTTTSSKSRRRIAAAVAATGILGVAAATTARAAPEIYGPDTTAAAGGGSGDTAMVNTTAPASEGTEASSGSAADGNAVVRAEESPLGTILVDQEGFTLYAFFADTEGESTCTGECLVNWPAAVVEEGELNVGDVDASLFSTIENEEAGTMLKAGDWPLYRFIGDAAPGDTNGQGLDQNGGLWYVVGPTGVPASLVNTRETSAGPMLVNSQGMTLYAFMNDTEGDSTCTGDCLANWPAAVVGESDTGVLDPELWSTVENEEAGEMLKVGDWPLYTFAGDAAPGDVNGQGVGDVWFAVAPDGTLIEGEITVADAAVPAGSAPAGTAPATTG